MLILGMLKKWFPNNKNLLFLIFIFSISIILRWPNMNHSLFRHHEWLSAHTLITEKAWDKDGIAKYYFSPVYKSGEQKELQADFFTVVTDKEGNTYYTSYPPFCFIASYLFFKIFFLIPGILTLQIFSLLIQLLTGLIIAKLLYEHAGKKFRSDVYLPGIAAFVVYTFSTANLWFCCNVYFADMLAQLFFAWGIYLLYRVLYTTPSKTIFYLLFLDMFCFAYTEWLSFFFIFVISVLLFLKFKMQVFKQRTFRILISAIGLATLVYFVQFILIDGAASFIEAVKLKFMFRTGTNTLDTDNGIYYLTSWLKVRDNFTTGYSYTLLLTIFLLVFAAINFRRIKKTGGKEYTFMLLLSLLPCILHALVLFNFTSMHDFSGLKFSIFLALSIGVLFSKFEEVKYASFVGIFVVMVFVWRSYDEYLKINPPSGNSDANKIIGEKIKSLRQKDEVVFVKEWGTPELVYYSEWIPYQQYTFEEAKAKLKEMKAKKGLYIYSEGMNILNITRFKIVGDSTITENIN